MKILVTGGAGFIGSAFVRLAIQQGHSIINLDTLTYAGNLANTAAVQNSPKYCFEKVDIRDGAALVKVLFKHAPDKIIHLAAESHVDRSIDGPADFIETNIVGTFRLLEAARIYWAQKKYFEHFRFHHVSTDEVYGSLDKDGAFHEDTPYAPNSPYSASKAASDHLVRAWSKTYELPVLLTNCSNNYGPYQFAEKLIPVVILNALARRPIPIYGNGENIRDWLYVDDHAKALLMVLTQSPPNQSYVIGGNNGVTNNTLVRLLCAELDRVKPEAAFHADLIEYVSDRPGHDQRYAIDTTHIHNTFGWVPSVSLKEGLGRTVKWYMDHPEWLQNTYAKNKITRLGVAI